jgi:hypothetical protein
MPWRPRYTKPEAAAAIADADSWAAALRQLGVKPIGKNYATIRRWAATWNIDTKHLSPHRPLGTAPRPRFTEEQLRDAVAVSRSWAETLRRLGYRTAGGNWKTIKRYVAAWGISTAHFDPHAASAEALQRRAKRRKPIEAILVSNSSYSRSHLKRRLFEEGLKAKRCELCGQGETWRGQPMALILDHINGASPKIIGWRT